MKRVFIFTILVILLMGFVLAIENGSNSLNNSDEQEDNEEENLLLGASCETVTRGHQNECCERNGYDSWDKKQLKCVKETNEEEDERDEDTDISCGTVSSGTENECCKENGYYGWDAEEFECRDKIENETEEDYECEPWNCTKWSECSTEGIRTRECVASQLDCKNDEQDNSNEDENETEDNEQQKLTKSCYEREELKPHERKLTCPTECVCSGSTIKCSFENGTKEMTIYAGESGNVIIQIKDMNVSTNVTLYRGEHGKVYGTFKGNKTHEVKLPDEAKESLQNHTRTRLYDESINLTDEGYYHIEGHKKSKLLMIIPVKENIRAEVDSETGETIEVKSSWWGFMASDVHEDDFED
jgi:hypothetical protein